MGRFYRFFGGADDRRMSTPIGAFSRPHSIPKPALTGKGARLGFGRRRISLFSRNLYRHGLLGRFIGSGMPWRAFMASIRARCLRARSLEEQRGYFDTCLAPLFDKRLIRWLTARQVSLYGLGIPPAQYEALAGAQRHGSGSAPARRAPRLRFSASRTIISPGRPSDASYAERASGPLPPYLRASHFDTIRARAGRVEVLNRSFTEYLQTRPTAPSTAMFFSMRRTG